MEEIQNKKAILNHASIAGLALGGVSIAYMFAAQWLPKLIPSAVAAGTLSVFLWMTKFVGCILLMRMFMYRLVRANDAASNRDTMKLGIYASVFSALFFSAASLANTLYINPEMIQQQFDLFLNIYSSQLDSNALAEIDRVKDMMPKISFFSEFIYCFIYGTALSAILSRNIPKRDPFAGFHNDGMNS